MPQSSPPSAAQRWVANHRVALRIAAGVFLLVVTVALVTQLVGGASRATWTLPLDLATGMGFFILIQSVTGSVDKWDAEHADL